ncbi:aminotransferase class IV [Parvularcula maris]|uniref:Probable branched-chain-amino-acid aminotransferase n=1 Tax=Parvularcula maris TaxID=2965077 RepID=A0A9X2L935_9PROT|nr:aminotransferase class IV [Parvularcula maris]
MIAEDDRGFLLADGVFDTLRVEDGRPLLLERHRQRLRRALTFFGMEEACEPASAAMEKALSELEGQTGSLRTTISRGSGPRGLRPPSPCAPVVLTRFAPSGPRPTTPATAALSNWRRSTDAPSSRYKTLAYTDNVLALAKAPEADDVVMLNSEGRPACTAMANFYALTGEGWITPPTSEGCLDGIVREVLLERGAVREAPIEPDDLRRYPLARSNSLVGVQRLRLEGGAEPDLAAAARLTAILEEAETEGT